MARHLASAITLGLVICVAATCDDPTPPLRDPVGHDLTLTVTSLTRDYNTHGIREKVQVNSAFTGSLLVDFRSDGARMEISGVPCVVPDGRLSVGGGFVNGKFESETEGGPLFNLTGRQDSVGVMTGTFTCQTRTQTPHYESYDGTFSARPKP